LPHQAQEAPSAQHIPEGCTSDEHAVIKVLIDNDRELMIDELSQRCGLVINQIASILLNLEFKGLVTSLPGKRFRLVKELAPA
jgi:DNA processing protein